MFGKIAKHVWIVSSFACGLGMTCAYAAVAVLSYVDDYGIQRGSWVVSDSGSDLDSQIGYYGTPSVDVRCDGTGWLAGVYSAPEQTSGFACGYSSAAEAIARAESECYARGGSECRAYLTLNDIGMYRQSPGETDPHYRLCIYYSDADTTC